jgi:hypothetical protein
LDCEGGRTGCRPGLRSTACTARGLPVVQARRPRMFRRGKQQGSCRSTECSEGCYACDQRGRPGLRASTVRHFRSGCRQRHTGWRSREPATAAATGGPRWWRPRGQEGDPYASVSTLTTPPIHVRGLGERISTPVPPARRLSCRYAWRGGASHLTRSQTRAASDQGRADGALPLPIDSVPSDGIGIACSIPLHPAATDMEMVVVVETWGWRWRCENT